MTRNTETKFSFPPFYAEQKMCLAATPVNLCQLCFEQV